MAARGQALQIVNRAVAFLDGSLVKSGFLKLSIDIACENRIPVQHGITPALQNLKPIMRLGCPVQIQAMPVKAPCAHRLRAKGLWTALTGILKARRTLVLQAVIAWYFIDDGQVEALHFGQQHDQRIR